MTEHRFTQLDVFGGTLASWQRGGLGNPLAVVHDADAMSAETMQAFARWTNLSETTFLSRATDPEADYAVRIFTPTREMRFAGHPTLGSAQAFLSAGGEPRRDDVIVQQCAVGNVRVRRDATLLSFAAPPVSERAPEADELGPALAALGLGTAQVRAARVLDNGSRWLALHIDDAQGLLALAPNHAALARIIDVGVIAPSTHDGCRFEVRAFAAASGIEEDPVTGGLNAALAQWLIGRGDAPSDYVVAQGTCIGRRGRVHVSAREGDVWIGGNSVPVISGRVRID